MHIRFGYITTMESVKKEMTKKKWWAETIDWKYNRALNVSGCSVVSKSVNLMDSPIKNLSKRDMVD